MKRLLILVLLILCACSNPNMEGLKAGECEIVVERFDKIEAIGRAPNKLAFFIDDYYVDTGDEIRATGTITYELCNSSPLGPSDTIIAVDFD